MGIFGGGEQPQREFGVRVNQSIYGLPLPVVMGTAQVQQSILWVDGFTSKQVSSKGGGKGGGKGGEYDYSADVVVGLCNGPILGVGDVWTGQSWLHSPTASEQYTISSGSSYQYTPANAANLYAILGVSVANSYSGSYNDLGAPSATVLSGTDSAPLTQVPYGTTLTTGLYSVNPSGNVFNFATADAGRTVTLSYSWLLTSEAEQQNVIVPSGKSVSVGGVGTGSTVNADYGVTYYTTGVAFTKVSGTPSATGSYSVSGSNPAVYKFATGDINAEVTISYGVNDPQAVSPGQAKSLNYTLQTGTQGQSPYAYLTSDYPDAAFGYTNIATLLYQPMDLGMSAEVQENRFEVFTADMFGGGIQDCNPVQCIGEVLTNSVWGLGVGPIPFPTSCIDNGTSGTWGGAASTPGARSVASTAWNWFAAQSFFISPVVDGQDTAASVCSKWLEAGMCAAFMSEGLLKLVPYGDTSAAANGVTWTAPSAYVVAFDDTCFIGKDGEDPVKISRVSTHDAWNVVQVQWDNRANEYAPEITQESDQSLINRWGERREDPQDWDFIHTLAAATFAANLRIKHNGYIRNTYEFTVPYTYSYVEPMDICTISTTSVWAAGINNANLGITNLPVRVLKIVDDPLAGLTLTCEDYPFGAHQPTLYNKQLSASEVIANAYADPGNSEVVMFEATNELTGFAGDEIWIGALGTSDNWGSCNIWVSQNGTSYQNVGTIKLPARLGSLASTFASGSDPDTVHSLVVNLATNCGSFDAGTTTDADSGNTLCFADGEIIAYSALTYTGQDQITMGTYIRRGQMGSTISSHSSGGLFLRLDNTIFKYTYPPAYRGQTLYFKFQSVNAFGVMAQDLSTLTPVTFTIPGDNPGSIDAETGLLLPSANPSRFIGAYSGSVAYVVGNEVTYSGSYYVCILNSTGNLPTNASYWQLVAAPNTSVFEGAYSGSTAYVPGNQVTYNGNYYICILATTGNAPTNATYWQQIANSETYLGTYNGSTAYNVGNQVSYLGNYYICISATTGNAPSLTSSYWTLVGTSAILLGTWSSSTAYVVGNQVQFNGNIYSCILANTNETPSTTSSYWTIVGSQSLSSIPVGGSLAKVATSAFTYSATTTSITIDWSSLTVYQVDGTVLSLGSSSQTITGLTAGTTYSVFPYWNGSAVEFVSSSNVSGLQSLTGVSMSGSGEITTATTFTETASSTHVTVEFWCYPTSGTGVCVGTAAGPAVELGLFGGSSYQLSVNGSTGGSGTIFGGTLTANFWNHVVVVFNYGGGAGSELGVTMYVNGISSTGIEAVSTETGQTWTIGAGYSGHTKLSGIIGRVAIYNNTLLTASQVTNHLNTMLSGGASAYDAQVESDGATYYWKLTETSGTTAVDSVDSNPGTYTGTYTLNDTQQIGGANGSPAIAWQNAPIQVTMYQFSQTFTPLIAGGYSVSTPATGSAGGVLPSFFVPGLPSNIVPPI